jgi:pyrroline-5-carboxylate reductase
MKIAFIGGGNMAAALIGGLIKRGVAPADLYAIDINDEARARTSSQFGIETGAAIDGTLAGFDAILLAVKPQVLKDVAGALAPHLSKQLVISIAAGIRAADLSRWLGGYTQIVRTMPNTPALIGMGVTGLAALPGVDDTAKALASKVLEAVGSAVWFDDEAKIDAVTAISGSGPAYIFYVVEAMIEAGVVLGLPRATATELVVQTLYGAATMLKETREHPTVLREQVSSPGGTTVAALRQLDDHKVRAAFVTAIEAAAARSRQLASGQV